MTHWIVQHVNMLCQSIQPTHGSYFLNLLRFGFEWNQEDKPELWLDVASCPSVYTSLFPSILAELILFSAFSVSLALSGICNSGPKFPILIAWWSIQVTDRPHKNMTVGTDSPPKALYIEGLPNTAAETVSL